MILPSFAGPVSVYKSEISLQENIQIQQQVPQILTYPVPFEKQSVAAASYEETSVLY